MTKSLTIRYSLASTIYTWYIILCTNLTLDWFYAGKSRSASGRLAGVGCAIRRTASLDTIYLKHQFPPEGLRMYCGHLLVDKATQVSLIIV
jgi:hypothetical protein